MLVVAILAGASAITLPNIVVPPPPKDINTAPPPAPGGNIPPTTAPAPAGGGKIFMDPGIAMNSVQVPASMANVLAIPVGNLFGGRSPNCPSAGQLPGAARTYGGKPGGHRGVDLAYGGCRGGAVYCPWPGVVSEIRNTFPGVTKIVVQHTDPVSKLKFYSEYKHILTLEQISGKVLPAYQPNTMRVQLGQQIPAGYRIADIGNNGHSFSTRGGRKIVVAYSPQTGLFVPTDVGNHLHFGLLVETRSGGVAAYINPMKYLRFPGGCGSKVSVFQQLNATSTGSETTPVEDDEGDYLYEDEF